MSMRRVVFLLVALVAAGGTAMMVRGYLKAERASIVAAPEAKPEIVLPEVLVAAEMLPAGLVVQQEHLRWQKWPEAGLSEEYFVKGQESLEDLIGSVVRAGIGPGEPLTSNRIVRPGDRGFLAAILQPGMRAVAVPVNATSGIAGLIFPGDRVDVILTHTINAGNEGGRIRRASETVLQNIRVLATDQRTDRQGGEAELAKTATLEVTETQAEMLAMVTELGKLSLSLRSLVRKTGEEASQVVADEEPSFTLDSDVSVLLDRPAGRAKHDAVEMSIVRGGEAQQVVF